MSPLSTSAVPVSKVEVSVFEVPTDSPESDGTLEWDRTTLVLVRAQAAETAGLGYTYADAATAKLIEDTFAAEVEGRDAMNVSDAWRAMVRRVRNLGRPGIASMAISAVDTALWDLKARLLELPLTSLLGQVRQGVPIYGSGGFTSYTDKQLEQQLGGWSKQGLRAVKMKVGRDAAADIHRVRVARQAIGPEAALYVDANGGYSRKQALAQAERFREFGVSWFEEPVSSDDLEGLRLLRDRAPAGMDIAAGEYGYDQFYFRRMLDAGAVDVLQADATRCGGFTGFLLAAALCQAHNLPLSAHTAPALHTHVCCSAIPLRNLEYEQGEEVEPASYAAIYLYGGGLRDLVEHALPEAQLHSADSLLAGWTAVKTPAEVGRIRLTCAIAAEAFARGSQAVRTGAAESEIANAFRAPLSEDALARAQVQRADGFVSCMSGPNSAKAAAAYAHSSARRVEPGDLVLVHCNSYADGFWTDITRTYCLGEPDPGRRRIYEAVATARADALQAIRPGVAARAVDEAARRTLALFGFSREFKHATGHGVGFAAIGHNARAFIPNPTKCSSPGWCSTWNRPFTSTESQACGIATWLRSPSLAAKC